MPAFPQLWGKVFFSALTLALSLRERGQVGKGKETGVAGGSVSGILSFEEVHAHCAEE